MSTHNPLEDIHLPQIRLELEAEMKGQTPSHRLGFHIENQNGCVCVIHNELRVLGFVLFVALLILVCAVLISHYALNLNDMDIVQNHLYTTGVIVAAAFTAMACFVSTISVVQHKRQYLHPPSQKHLIRILYMVPIYAVASFLGILSLKLNMHYSQYIDFFRTCYEAFVIYSFLILLTKYLGGHSGVVAIFHRKPPAVFPWPLNKCLAARPCDSDFLWFLKNGTLQYAIVAPLTAFCAMFFQQMGWYEDGVLSPANAYFWCSMAINCSQLWALYALVWMFTILKEELEPFNPMIKFLTVKMVVFFTFWQGIALALAVRYSLITDDRSDNMTTGQVQVAINNTLICVEMFIASIAHKYAFPWEVYADGSLQQLMEARAIESVQELKLVGDVADAGLDDELTSPGAKTDTFTAPQLMRQRTVLGGPPEPGSILYRALSAETGSVGMFAARVYDDSDSHIHPAPAQSTDKPIKSLDDLKSFEDLQIGATKAADAVCDKKAPVKSNSVHDIARSQLAKLMNETKTAIAEAKSSVPAAPTVTFPTPPEKPAITSPPVSKKHHQPVVFTFERTSKQRAAHPAIVATVTLPGLGPSLIEDHDEHHDQTMDALIAESMQKKQ